MQITNKARRLVLLISVVLLSGCVEFEQQVLTYRLVDDELIIFQEYYGIFGKELDNPKKNKEKKLKTVLTDAEKQEIRSVVNGERTFFFNNWMTEYNRAKLLEKVSRLEHPQQELSASDKQYRRIWLPLIRLLLANVTVTNGEFFYDAEQRLSAYQVVRITNLKQLIEQANRSISLAISAEIQSRNAEGTNRKSDPRYRALAEAGFDWIKINGNRISVSFPASQEEFLKARNEAQTYVGRGAPVVEVTHHDGLITIVIGTPGDQPVTISKQVQSPYSANAVQHVGSEYGIREQLDIPQLKQAAFE
jgi:hypothetical protein